MLGGTDRQAGAAALYRRVVRHGEVERHKQVWKVNQPAAAQVVGLAPVDGAWASASSIVEAVAFFRVARLGRKVFPPRTRTVRLDPFRKVALESFHKRTNSCIKSSQALALMNALGAPGRTHRLPHRKANSVEISKIAQACYDRDTVFTFQYLVKLLWGNALCAIAASTCGGP